MPSKFSQSLATDGNIQGREYTVGLGSNPRNGSQLAALVPAGKSIHVKKGETTFVEPAGLETFGRTVRELEMGERANARRPPHALDNSPLGSR